MMPWYIILNHSILLAAAIGAWRFRTYHKSLHPFIILCWLATANETLSLVLLYTTRDNTINGNLYTLAEYGLLLWQFQSWKVLRQPFFIVLASAGIMIWALDNLLLHSIKHDNSLFRICYALAIVVLSMETARKRALDARGPFFRDSIFMLAAGMLLYFSAKAFMEVFNLFDNSFSAAFEARLFFTLCIINGITNLIYATTLLCIPMKQRYLVHS